jgi:uncharacterized protein (DUF1330 family)
MRLSHLLAALDAAGIASEALEVPPDGAHDGARRPAYVVAEILVTGRGTHRCDAMRIRPVLGRFGGSLLAVGRKTIPLEGAPFQARVVVIRFPGPEQARRFWDSPEYRAIAPIRQHSAKPWIILADGAAAAASASAAGRRSPG